MQDADCAMRQFLLTLKSPVEISSQSAAVLNSSEWRLLTFQVHNSELWHFVKLCETQPGYISINLFGVACSVIFELSYVYSFQARALTSGPDILFWRPDSLLKRGDWPDLSSELYSFLWYPIKWPNLQPFFDFVEGVATSPSCPTKVFHMSKRKGSSQWTWSVLKPALPACARVGHGHDSQEETWFLICKVVSGVPSPFVADQGIHVLGLEVWGGLHPVLERPLERGEDCCSAVVLQTANLGPHNSFSAKHAHRMSCNYTLVWVMHCCNRTSWTLVHESRQLYVGPDGRERLGIPGRKSGRFALATQHKSLWLFIGLERGCVFIWEALPQRVGKRGSSQTLKPDNWIKDDLCAVPEN